ncbi:putative spore germination protein [Paenibacillus sp. 598K]|nr:putative spore germination protein [Paenibacillus sp. 598K]
MAPLMQGTDTDERAVAAGEPSLRFIAAGRLSIGHVRMHSDLGQAIRELLFGSCLILTEGAACALSAEIKGAEERPVSEPTTETVLRGPQHSFNENINTNVALIRRIIHSEQLRVQSMLLGSQTQTNVSIVYLEDIVDKQVLQSVTAKLEQLKIDALLEGEYLEELFIERGYTPFPLIFNTERPDSVAGALLEGRIAILVDGTPFVLVAPATFFSFFQSPEDYYQRADIATFLRLTRFAAYFVSMLLPGLYIAVTTFHPEMLPTPLLISLAAQREGIPFPAFIEAMLMELTFEVLREAGVRMPRAIGPAISIVGALVLGQASVQAGLVSAGMVIIVSFTAIASFSIPQISIAATARLFRFLFMGLAAVLGFFGLVAGVILLLVHLARLRSFGISYLAPLSPLQPGALRDVFIRASWKTLARDRKPRQQL